MLDEWGFNHKSKKHASTGQRNDEGHWVGTSACTEGLCNVWTDEKGD